MGARRYVALVATLLACIATAQADALRVLYAEPFQPAIEGRGTTLEKLRAAPRMRIDAFGRRFDLELADNTALLRAARISADQRDSIALFKGSLRDAPGSWVRLALIDGRYEGAFWDGADLYAISARSTIEAELLAPLAASSSASAIYRLSDTQDGLLAGTCAAESQTPSRSSLSRYRNLVNELKAAFAEKTTASQEVTVAMVGDFEFVNRTGANALVSLITRANVVDGIFSDQVGISIVPTDFITYSSDIDSFTSSDAPTLLSQVADFKESRGDLSGRGIVHLVTGRPLDGSTVGIAYLNSVCHTRAGSSLSESSAFIDSALIMAHEIGHNLGARHDGETGSTCATTPRYFLMAPEFNHSATLSACSIDSIRAAVAAAACLTPVRDRDVAITVPADSVSGIVDQSLHLHADVRALTAAGGANVSVMATVPSIPIEHASMPGASCSVNFNQVTCLVPQLAFGESSRLTLSLLPHVALSGTAIFTVKALNDANPANDRHDVDITISSMRDIHIKATTPDTVVYGEPFDLTLDVRSSGVLPLVDVHTTIDVSQEQVIAANVEGGAACTIQSMNVQCPLGGIEPGTSRRITLTLRSTVVGSQSVRVVVEDRGVTPTVTRYQWAHWQTSAARDLSVEFAPQSRRIAAGVASEWPLVIKSHGVYAVTGSRVRIEKEAALAALAIDLPAGCAEVDSHVECELGTVAPGATVSIPFTIQSNMLVDDAQLIARLIHTEPDNGEWNDITFGMLTVASAIEVAISGGSSAQPYDLLQASFSTYIRSLGANAVDGATATVTLPEGFRVVEAWFGSTACSVQSPAEHIATCMLPQLRFPGGDWLRVDFVAPMPGTFEGSVIVAAPGDADSTNNEDRVAFDVKPFVDGRLQSNESPGPQLASEAFTLEFTASANRHVLPDAGFVYDWYGPLAEVSASWPGGSCRSVTSPLRCQLGDLPANSSTAISLTVTPQTSGYVAAHAHLYSLAEARFGDNTVHANYSLIPLTDLALTTNQTQFTATVGMPIVVSGISVTTGSPAPRGFVDLELDTALVRSVELSGARCEGDTFPQRCAVDFYGGMPHQLTLRVVPAVAGEIPIKIRIGAMNDSTPANNEVVLTIQSQAAATAPQTPPPSSNSGAARGGGGGGGMDWQLLGLLLTLFGLNAALHFWSSRERSLSASRFHWHQRSRRAH